MTDERDVRRSAADRILEQRRRIAAETRGTISTGRWARNWIRSIALALALFLLVRSFLVEAFRIPTGSMENTLLVGDFLLVSNVAFAGRAPSRDEAGDLRDRGFVGRARITDRPVLIYYAYDARTRRPPPSLTGIRWARVGDRVH